MAVLMQKRIASATLTGSMAVSWFCQWTSCVRNYGALSFGIIDQFVNRGLEQWESLCS